MTQQERLAALIARISADIKALRASEWYGTQQQYDALATKSSSTTYYITG